MSDKRRITPADLRSKAWFDNPHNPGMTDHHWRGDLVRIGRTDPGAAERLLLQHAGR